MHRAHRPPLGIPCLEPTLSVISSEEHSPMQPPSTREATIPTWRRAKKEGKIGVRMPQGRHDLSWWIYATLTDVLSYMG